ncbi:MAG: hypothetical protein M0Z82_02775 [Actinomycetota bacterium]|nr:hypothetical protein [Actinomycetota bacterium]
MHSCRRVAGGGVALAEGVAGDGGLLLGRVRRLDRLVAEAHRPAGRVQAGVDLAGQRSEPGAVVVLRLGVEAGGAVAVVVVDGVVGECGGRVDADAAGQPVGEVVGHHAAQPLEAGLPAEAGAQQDLAVRGADGLPGLALDLQRPKSPVRAR